MRKYNLKQEINGRLYLGLLAIVFYGFGMAPLAAITLLALLVTELGGFAHMGKVAGDNVSGAQAPTLSKIVTTYDILKPSVRSKLIRRYGAQMFSFFSFLESLGYSRPITQRYTTQYEEDWILQPIILGSSISSLGSNSYSFTLSTTAPNLAYLEQNTTSPYSSAGQYVFPVQKAMVLAVPENNVRLWVSNVSITGSTCTVTVTHMNPTTSPFTYGNYGNGSVFTKAGTAYAEGSGVYGSQSNKPIIDHAYTQILKERYTYSGSQMASQTWFNSYTDDSGEISNYTVVGQNNTEYLMHKAIDDILWFGAKEEVSIIDTTSVDGVAGNEPIYTTEGLEPYIKRTGYNLGASYGSFTMTEFDQLDKVLEQNGAGAWMAWFRGVTISNEMDNVMKAYFQHTDQKYMMEQAERDLFSGDPGMAMEVKFKYFDKGGRKWCFGRVPQWNQKNSWGESGFKKDGLSLIFPMGSKPDKVNPTNRIPYMGAIYRELDGYNRKYMAWTVNGASGNKVTTVDRNDLVLLADVGAEHAAGPQMARRFIS